jgi:L-lactate dehydrogenase complex protein LldE
MRVALLVTCLVDGVVPSVGKATVEVLERLGVRVEVPSAQTCCGQMHTNTGYAGLARPLARAYAEVFAGYDYVVTPSGSCAGSVRHQHPALTGEQPPRTLELSEFLVDVLGVEDVGATYPHRVTYHPTCHSLRLLRVGDRPLRLLRKVRGLQLVELPEADSCCGFGGTFALKNPDVSAAMLADKVRQVQSTRAAVCTASDASCLLHIGGGLSRLKVGTRTVHLAEILASRG